MSEPSVSCQDLHWGRGQTNKPKPFNLWSLQLCLSLPVIALLPPCHFLTAQRPHTTHPRIWPQAFLSFLEEPGFSTPSLQFLLSFQTPRGVPPPHDVLFEPVAIFPCFKFCVLFGTYYFYLTFPCFTLVSYESVNTFRAGTVLYFHTNCYRTEQNPHIYNIWQSLICLSSHTYIFFKVIAKINKWPRKILVLEYKLCSQDTEILTPLI